MEKEGMIGKVRMFVDICIASTTVDPNMNNFQRLFEQHCFGELSN